MATVTFGKSGTRPYGVLTVTETATNTANNTSTLSIKLVLKRPYAIESTATKTASCTINGTKYTWSGTIGGSGDLTLISKTQTVTHNADGSKSISISASITLDITWVDGSIGTISGSGTMALTKIARYATASQSLTARTETTATIKWSSDSTVDYIWYSTNNGSTWTGINIADGTSGTYTISGLSAGTTYQVKTRVRRKDTQLTTDSSALSVSTYSYPYANSMPNFTIGNSVKIGVYNPLGHTVTINLIGADGSVCATDTLSGTSITGFSNETIQNRLYASIPNAKSGTYKVKITYGTQASEKTGGTYTVNTSVCSPTIGAVAYQDTSTKTMTLTGNNQDIVRNQSIVGYSASGLTALKSATLKSCKVTVNGNTYNLTINGSTASGGGSVINSANNVDAVFTLTDSRGLMATKKVSINMLDWITPTAIVTLQRHNNYYSETDILVDADFPSINGNNKITITYKAKKSGDSSYTVSGTLQDNVTSVITLDNSYSWEVVVSLTDSLGGTATYTVNVAVGMPIIYFDRLKLSVGINCFPNDEKSLEVNGINLEKSVMTRTLGADITSITTSAYTMIPLTLDKSAGGRLSVSDDGGIVIGKNISKILVSGRMSMQVTSAGKRHLQIIKNTRTNANILAWNCISFTASSENSVVITPTLADVQEGDVIYLFYYTTDSTDKILGGSYGSRTYLTVETVQ